MTTTENTKLVWGLQSRSLHKRAALVCNVLDIRPSVSQHAANWIFLAEKL